MTPEPYNADDMRRQYIEYMEYEDCIDEIFTAEEEEEKEEEILIDY